MTTLSKTLLTVTITGLVAGSIIDFGGFNVNPVWMAALPFGAVFYGLFLISFMLEKEVARSRRSAAAQASAAASSIAWTEAARRRSRLICAISASVLEVDATSRAAGIEGGAFGPALESQLKPHGLTLRHFPQSFEYSTLGGWIATRSGGHFASLYTHIDDLVESLRVVTPAGVIETRRLPGSGAGPSPDRMFIGSEGILGVISQAWMRLQPKPTFRAGGVGDFETFFAAARAVRAIAQAGLFPSNCRILDPTEAYNTGAADGSVGDPGAGLRIGRPSGRGLDEARARMLRRPRRPRPERPAPTRHREGAAGLWRNAFIRMPYAREFLTPRRHHQRHFRDRDHLGAVRSAPRRGEGGDRAGHSRGDGRQGRGHLPLHPCLSRRSRALFLVPCARPARRADRAMAGDQGRGERRADRGGRHHHPSPRRRARSPPWYDRQRPALFAAALRAAKARSIRAA